MSFRENKRAVAAIATRQYGIAIDIYKKRVEANAADTEALLFLAHCYEWNGEIELALQYANKCLAQDPTEFQMLLLVARCWCEKKNDEQTYNYVCRAIENVPYSEPEESPKIFYLILKCLSVFKRFRGIEARARKGMLKWRKDHKESVQWALNYKRWYESKNLMETGKN